MDSELLRDCEIIARSAYRRSLIVTAAIVLAFFVFAVDCYLIASDPFRSYRNSPTWEITLIVKIVITIVLSLMSAFRLGGYLTYSRFIDTMARKKPISVFMALKRHRDGLAADENDRRQQAKDASAAKQAELESRLKAALE